MARSLPTLADRGNILSALSNQKSNQAAEDALELTAPSDTHKTARLGLIALAVGFGGFLLWAALAPLDEGVPSQAQVTIDTKRKPVQHQIGGIVKEVSVREGQIVQANQTLIKLDDAVSAANLEAIRQRYLGLRAMEGRLQAEQAGMTAIAFHPDLLAAAKSDPVIAQHMRTQSQLLLTRRSALNADAQALEESIQGQQGLIRSYSGMLDQRREQLKLLNEELQNTRDLVKDGYAPRNRLLELERMTAESNLNITDIQGNILRTQRNINELQQRKILRQQEYRKEVETVLADVSREVQSDASKVTAAVNEMQRTEIKAPTSGQVVGLNFQTVGSVIGAGQKIMDIVPENEHLILEARVSPHMIDRVHTGLPVDIRFSGFSHSPQLVVGGIVSSVSKDLLSEPQTNNTYYLARVALTDEGQKALGNRHMQPGMPAEVVFKTGERSLLTYLLQPFTKRLAASMKEE